MKKKTLALLAFTTFISSHAIANSTVGVGFGSLYNGLGINAGRTTDVSMTYGSLGCMGGSLGHSTTLSAGDYTNVSESSSETNCGFGLGYISTSPLSGNNHALGLNLGYTHNTADDVGGSEFYVMPGYYFFFNGINQRGPNLGFGTQTRYFEERSTQTGVILNLGYQF
ncbi:MAG: hypothetical protein AB8B97_20095 [Granulosicoccus sp.]